MLQSGRWYSWMGMMCPATPRRGFVLLATFESGDGYLKRKKGLRLIKNRNERLEATIGANKRGQPANRRKKKYGEKGIVMGIAPQGGNYQKTIPVQKKEDPTQRVGPTNRRRVVEIQKCRGCRLKTAEQYRQP